MEARYLRVKNWSRFQHYDPEKRRPPWIKFHNDVLGEDDAFMRLSELEQWQLVRVWLIASRSSLLTRDEKGKLVPAIVDNEPSLRRSIMSAKKVPLAKFIREGWLIPVASDELDSPEAASTVLADGYRDASAGASADASALLGSRGLEEHKDPFGVSVEDHAAAADEHQTPDFDLRTMLRSVA